MPDPSFRILCWNVMAPEHAAIIPTDRPDFYARSRPFVTWAQRQDRLLSRLRLLGPDLACLQELSAFHLRAAFGRKLRELGAELRFAKKKLPTQPDGVGTLVRTEVFEILEEERLTLDEARGHVGLLLALRHRASGRTFELLNLHVRWSPDDTTQVDQTRAALAALDARPAADRIVCGDFNLDVLRSPLAADFAARGYSSAYPDDARPTWAADGRTQKVDALLSSPGLRLDDVLPLPPLTADPGLPSEEMPSDHVPLGARATLVDGPRTG